MSHSRDGGGRWGNNGAPTREHVVRADHRGGLDRVGAVRKVGRVEHDCAARARRDVGEQRRERLDDPLLLVRGRAVEPEHAQRRGTRRDVGVTRGSGDGVARRGGGLVVRAAVARVVVAVVVAIPLLPPRRWERVRRAPPPPRPRPALAWLRLALVDVARKGAYFLTPAALVGRDAVSIDLRRCCVLARGRGRGGSGGRLGAHARRLRRRGGGRHAAKRAEQCAAEREQRDTVPVSPSGRRGAREGGSGGVA